MTTHITHTEPTPAPPSSVEDVLAAVEPLSHAARYRRMIELGRQSVARPKLARALETLVQSEIHYERLLALMSASGSRAPALVAALLAGRSQSLALRAVKLAARLVPDAELVGLMPDLARACRQRLAHRLWQAGRARVNDAVHPLLHGAARRSLFAWTSDAFVRAHLDAGQSAMLDAAQWKTLARRMPGLIHDALARELAQSERACAPDCALRIAFEAALHGMWPGAPATGLSLLRAAAGRVPIDAWLLARYARHFPHEIAAIVRALGDGRQVHFSAHALRRLDAASLCELAAIDALPGLPQVFPQLRAAQRDALYRHSGEAWRQTSGALPLNFVQALSRQTDRHAEARHALALARLEAEPAMQLGYLCCLPFQEALTRAQPFLAQPDGELRAHAVGALIQSARYEASSLDAALAFCAARANEQDPVRLAMFGALAALPPARWQTRHLPGFTALIEAALAARDGSPPTMSAAAQWLMSIVVEHTDFVVATLPRLVGRMGSLGSSEWRRRASRLGEREATRIAACLMPLLDTWVARNRAAAALHLIAGFGRRALAVSAFADLCARLTDDPRAHVARSGLDALAHAGFTQRLAGLIPDLVERDPGWIQVPAVAQHLHRRRQDLLTPFLRARVYTGRFSSGNAALLPAFDDDFARWSATQQHDYAQPLLDVLASPRRTAQEYYRAVQRYATMPSIDLAPLVELARLDAPDPALRDKALEALGRADAGRGLTTLGDALHDARARVAIYALRSIALNLPASQERATLALLGRVPRGQIAVLKEVVRIAGDLQSEAARAFLARIENDDEPLHQDVRIALLRASWNDLDQPEAWQKLHAAATSPLAAIARATIRIPPAGLSASGQRALSQHLALLLAHPDAQIRRETLERLIVMPPGQRDPALYAALCAQLDDANPALVERAARALLGLYARHDAQALAGRFAQVARAQALVAIVDAYRQCRAHGLLALDVSARQFAEALKIRRWHPGQALRLAFSILPPDACLTLARQFDAAGLLHPGALADALDALASMVAGQPLRALVPVEKALGDERSASLRRIGLGLLCELAAKGGWTHDARQRLAASRADPERWIADAADLVKCPDKLAGPVAAG